MNGAEVVIKVQCVSDLFQKVYFFFFFQAEDGIRDTSVTGVQTCALPILGARRLSSYETSIRGPAMRFEGTENYVATEDLREIGRAVV